MKTRFKSVTQAKIVSEYDQGIPPTLLAAFSAGVKTDLLWNS